MTRKSRTAIVTGGASGMGLAVVEQMVDRGDRVAILDLNGDAAAAQAERLTTAGGQAIGVAVDVADRASVEAAVQQVRDAFGPIEILVTSAGLARFEKFLEISQESWQRVIDVNLTGTFNCTQTVLPDMVAGGWGRIVTISSSSAQRGAPRMGHYASSKGGVMTLSRVLAHEFGKHGITVNDVPPSAIETPMTVEARAAGNLPAGEVLAKNIPAGRMGEPADIAAAVLFLTTDEASYINGQILGVNGGAV